MGATLRTMENRPVYVSTGRKMDLLATISRVLTEVLSGKAPFGTYLYGASDCRKVMILKGKSLPVVTRQRLDG